MTVDLGADEGGFYRPETHVIIYVMHCLSCGGASGRAVARRCDISGSTYELEIGTRKKAFPRLRD